MPSSGRRRRRQGPHRKRDERPQAHPTRPHRRQTRPRRLRDHRRQTQAPGRHRCRARRPNLAADQKMVRPGHEAPEGSMTLDPVSPSPHGHQHESRWPLQSRRAHYCQGQAGPQPHPVEGGRTKPQPTTGPVCSARKGEGTAQVSDGSPGVEGSRRTCKEKNMEGRKGNMRSRIGKK